MIPIDLRVAWKPELSNTANPLAIFAGTVTGYTVGGCFTVRWDDGETTILNTAAVIAKLEWL